MSKILIRSGKDPFTPVAAEATLAQDVFNSNVGNYLFAHSVHRTLMTPSTELVPNATLSETRPATDRDADRINEQFDAFVVPLANAFRRSFLPRLRNLTSLIEKLTIPVVVVGVGAQTDLNLDLTQLSELDPTVKAFTAAVLDRSAAIGVRGEFTADYLRWLGFPDSTVEVIGCPSLFLHGPDFRLATADRELGADARIALNLTRRVTGAGQLSQTLMRRHPNLVYLGQDRDDLRLMLWGQEPVPPAERDFPLHLGHQLYREGRVRFPLDTWTWLDYLAGFDFALGTRLHGNVAALLAGIPAMLLPHDSRTLELADYHDLPHRRTTGSIADLTAEELYGGYDPTGFNAGYAGRFHQYLSFLERNGLAHVYADGQENPQFADRVDRASLPPLLTPLAPGDTQQVAARLRWLRDGQTFDARRHPQAYRQPFPYRPPDQRAEKPAHEPARLAVELAKTQERLRRQGQLLERQRELLGEQARRLDRLEARGASSLPRRVARRLFS